MKKLLIIIILLLIPISLFVLKYNKEKDKKSMFENISIYKKENENRYKSYYLKYPNLSKEKIVLYVNIGIDNKHYTNISNIKYTSFNTLVNKYNALDESFKPEALVKLSNKYTNKEILVDKMMIKNLNNMISDMKKENMDLIVVSGYRTKEYQYSLYTKYVKKEGKEKADLYSARPRHSEHELGLAIDVTKRTDSMLNFYNSEEYKWLLNNSYKYGFILRYPKEKEHITGYMFEPWHYRYIGKNLAKKVYESKLTYDEYYELFLARAFLSNK